MRRRLLGQLVPSLVLIWLVGCGFILMRSWDELQASYVDQIDHLAHTLAEVLDDHALTPDAVSDAVRARRDRNIFVIVARDDQILFRSARAPKGLIDRPRTSADRSKYFFAEATARNGSVTILTGVEQEEVRQLTAEVVVGAAVPMALGLLAMVAVVYISVSRVLRPIDALREELELRQANTLDPVEGSDLPAELEPVLEALNHLLARLREAVQHERRFVADASHELRTPLAAIRAQVDTIDRTRLDPETNFALDQIIRGVARSTRLAQQLLRLARADATEAGAPQEMALDVEVTSIVSELFPMAVLHDSEIEVEAGPARVNAYPGDLDMLVGNLVENAIHHGGPKARVRISCGQENGVPWLRVEDSGSGIPDGSRSELFQRFRRGKGSRTEGAGLGLSIVLSVAERLGAKILLGRSNVLGGFGVEVCFPPFDGTSNPSS